MTKDEMKNRISLALKDPILQQGFEIICKENVKLLEKLKNQKADYETYYKSCYNAQKKAEKQLTKAKEIIKTFCGFCSVFNSTNGSFDNLIAEAEQFLNSEVEK